MVGSCFHYSGIYYLFYASNIATVFPYLSYNSGLCYHSSGISDPYLANIIATVYPLSFYIFG